MIKATRNLIESSKYERAEEDTTIIHGYTSPINSKGFKNLANTVDNLIGMSRNTNVSDKIKHAALELKERFFQHGITRLAGGIDAQFSDDDKLYGVKTDSFVI